MSGGGTRTETAEPWEAQIKPLKFGFGEARKIYDEGAPKYYSGPTVAGFDPSQQAAQAGILGYAMGPRVTGMQREAENQLFGMYDIAKQTPEYAMGRGNVAQGYADDAVKAIAPTTADMMSGQVNMGEGSPYASMMDALGTQTMNQLTGKILPGIRQNIVQYQPGGGSRGDIVQANAIAAANQQMLNKAAEMYGGAYSQAQAQRLPAVQQALGAYGQASDAAIRAGQLGLSGFDQAGSLSTEAFNAYPSLMGAPISMYQQIQDVGDKRQAMSQAAIDQDVARYNYQSMSDQNALADFMSMISGDYGGSKTVPGPSGMQTLGQVASIAGSLAPLVAGFSDIRIKENIEPDGTWHGHNVYTYNFKGRTNRSRGVMAQEVEITRPDAVFEIDGIKHVNYGAL
jgi:hypothetical protein